MIVRLQVHRLRPLHPYSPLHEVSLVVVIDSRSRIVYLVKLHKRKAPLFLSHVVKRYLNRLNLPKGAEEGKDLLLVDPLRQVSHINSPLEVLILLHLF